MVNEGHVGVECFDPTIHLFLQNVGHQPGDFEHVADRLRTHFMGGVIGGWNHVVDIPGGFSEINSDFRRILKRRQHSPFTADACGGEIPNQKHGVDSEGNGVRLCMETRDVVPEHEHHKPILGGRRPERK